jgi:serine/threonine-protein kinase RsbW
MFISQQESCRQEALETLRMWRRQICRHVLHSAKDIHAPIALVVEDLERQGAAPKHIFAVRLALEEALVNAVHHGNHDDPHRTVHFNYVVAPEGVFARIVDEGDGFDLKLVPDPRRAECLDKSSGRGLFLMGVFMTGVWFNRRGNGVTLYKRLTAANGSADPLREYVDYAVLS